MALNPKILLEVNKKCDKVSLIEETGIYVTTNNIGGWGTPNISTDEPTQSSVKVYDLNDTTLNTFILKSNTVNLYDLAVSAPTPSPFTIISESDWDNKDGVYKIEYQLFADSTFYTSITYQLFLCNLCNCKQNLICKMVKECNIIEVNKLKKIVDELEIFIYGIQSAFSCQNYTLATSILDKATIYCKTLTDCDCGCKDC